MNTVQWTAANCFGSALAFVSGPTTTAFRLTVLEKHCWIYIFVVSVNKVLKYNKSVWLQSHVNRVHRGAEQICDFIFVWYEKEKVFIAILSEILSLTRLDWHRKCECFYRCPLAVPVMYDVQTQKHMLQPHKKTIYLRQCSDGLETQQRKAKNVLKL